MMNKKQRATSAFASLTMGDISEEEFATELYDIDNMLFKLSDVANAIYDGEATFINCFKLYEEFMSSL